VVSLSSGAAAVGILLMGVNTGADVRRSVHACENNN
jgi:hypothetical protein